MFVRQVLKVSVNQEKAAKWKVKQLDDMVLPLELGSLWLWYSFMEESTRGKNAIMRVNLLWVCERLFLCRRFLLDIEA